jgi:superfamily I DNA/RNA helicase
LSGYFLTSEQNNILNKLTVSNLIVDSVAGSGKTTSILHIAKKFITSKILCLTYNAKLKIETREKIRDLNLTNIEAHSYHSFCVKYYSKKAYNDVEILSLIKKEINPKIKLNYSMIILDEAQDLTPIYYELVLKILSDNEIGC